MAFYDFDLGNFCDFFYEKLKRGAYAMEALAGNNCRVILFGGFEELTRRIADDFKSRSLVWVTKKRTNLQSYYTCQYVYMAKCGTFLREE